MKYSNEYIIADISEVFANEEAKADGERPVCLSFENPYSLQVVNETEGGYNVTFKKFNPFSDDRRYNVGFDLVAMINNCKAAVVDAYQQKVTLDTTPPEESNEETTTTE
tara:strand:+ start:131 stop:457 length:327 start_codon:yes stop_codon:yes gene_type:complete